MNSATLLLRTNLFLSIRALLLSTKHCPEEHLFALLHLVYRLMMDTSNSSHPLPSSSSIHVTHRSNRTAYMTLIQLVLRIIGGKLAKPKRQKHPEGEWSIRLTVPEKIKQSFDITSRQVAGIWTYDIIPRQMNGISENDKPPQRKRLYYFAGGSWQTPPESQHWKTMARWAENMPNTKISLVSAPLAPEYPAPKALDKLLEFYKQIMEETSVNELSNINDGGNRVDSREKIIWAGDSSGANLAICLTLQGLHRYPNLRAPAAVMAICPSTDLTRSNPEIKTIEKNDPLLSYDAVVETASAWAGDWSKEDQRISPLYADLAPLLQNNVQVHGVTAGYDVLSPDGIKFREKLEKAGVAGKWLEWDKQIHDFPLTWMYGLSEANEALEWIRAVIEES